MQNKKLGRQNTPLTNVSMQHLENIEGAYELTQLPIDLIQLLVELDLSSSKGASRNLIKNGGVYLNNERILDDKFKVTTDILIEGTWLLIGVGKKRKKLVKLRLS